MQKLVINHGELSSSVWLSFYFLRANCHLCKRSNANITKEPSSTLNDTVWNGRLTGISNTNTVESLFGALCARIGNIPPANYPRATRHSVYWSKGVDQIRCPNQQYAFIACKLDVVRRWLLHLYSIQASRSLCSVYRWLFSTHEYRSGDAPNDTYLSWDFVSISNTSPNPREIIPNIWSDSLRLELTASNPFAASDVHQAAVAIVAYLAFILCNDEFVNRFEIADLW